MIAYESLVKNAVHVGAFRGIVSAESSWSIRCVFLFILLHVWYNGDVSDVSGLSGE